MTEDSPFFTFGESDEVKKTPQKVPHVSKVKQENLDLEKELGKIPNKIIVHRSIDSDKVVCIVWADRDSIYPQAAIRYYETFREFYGPKSKTK